MRQEVGLLGQGEVKLPGAGVAFLAGAALSPVSAEKVLGPACQVMATATAPRGPVPRTSGSRGSADKDINCNWALVSFLLSRENLGRFGARALLAPR